MPTIEGKKVPYNAEGIAKAKRAKKRGKKVHMSLSDAYKSGMRMGPK